MLRKHFLLPAASVIIVACLAIAAWNNPFQNKPAKDVYRHSNLIRVTADYAYRDLNKNGKLDVYEDSKQPIEARIDDILKQMTPEEKAGMMFINGARVNDDGSIEDKPAQGMFAFAPNALKLMREKR